MKNVACYIDGFNLYHAIDNLKDDSLKWLNLSTLVKSYLREGEQILKISYFTAIQNWDHHKKERHEAYIDVLRELGVDVHIARFKKSKKKCKKYERYCKFDEEKQTDVGLAVSMISDAYAKQIDRIILVTADTDQIPAVSHLKTEFPKIELTLAIPPGRKNEARDLGALFSAPTEIGVGRLGASLLPDVVLGASGQYG